MVMGVLLFSGNARARRAGAGGLGGGGEILEVYVQRKAVVDTDELEALFHGWASGFLGFSSWGSMGSKSIPGIRHHLPAFRACGKSPRSHIAVTVLCATLSSFAAFPVVYSRLVMNSVFIGNAKYEQEVHDLSSHSVHIMNGGLMIYGTRLP